VTRGFKTGWLLLALLAGMGEAWAGSGPPPIIVTNSVELQQALVPANAGRHIIALSGDYPISEPLVVPEGATLEGEGVMLFEDGFPSVFEPGTETRLLSVAPFAGDLLTLRDGAKLRGLIVEEVKARSGNAVGIRSAHSHDAVSASIFECEIIGFRGDLPVPLIGLDGPINRAMVAITQAGHGDAAMAAQVERTVIRGHQALFALNFGNRGQVEIAFTGNRVGGTLVSTGGVSRPILIPGPDGLTVIHNEVTGAATTIRSHGNLYAGPGQIGPAWGLLGGSDPPLNFPEFPGPGSSFNTLRFYSVDDRIEDHAWGIVATAARRYNDSSGLSQENLVDLHLLGLTLQTTVLDMVLVGVQSVSQLRQEPVGDENTLRVVMRDVTGSGHRPGNVFEHGLGLSDIGTGNQLVIVGNQTAFEKTNDSIEPAPRSEFFSSPN
jgi:hypothetical protein